MHIFLDENDVGAYRKIRKYEVVYLCDIRRRPPLTNVILIHPKSMSPPFNNRIFEPSSGLPHRDYGFYGYYWRCTLRDCLRERGYELKTIDLGDVRRAEKIIFISMHKNGYFQSCIKHKLNETMVLFEVEFPISKFQTEAGYPTDEYRNQFGKVLTWNENIVDNARIFKMHRPNNWYRGEIEKISFKDRKLCVMVNTNKYSDYALEQYSERRKAILFFQENCPNQFDLYGNWDRSVVRYVANRLPFVKYNEKGVARKVERKLGIEKAVRWFLNEPDYSKCWKGWTSNVYQTISKYRFRIVYECTGGMKGAVSNKIFDTLQAGCVPIYLGATNITEIVPANAFINKRSFAYPELLEYLESVGEAEFEEYLSNIDVFLKSKEGRGHFEKDWAEEFCKVLLS